VTLGRKKSGHKPAAKNVSGVSKPDAPVVGRSESGQRLLRVPKRVWYKPLTWRHRQPVPAYAPLPKARLIFRDAIAIIWTHKGLFAGIVLVCGVFDILLVHGLSNGSDLAAIRGTLDGATHGAGGKALTSLASFSYLLTNAGGGNGSDTAGLYESILLVLGSLASIWALRQVQAGHKVRVRDSFYQGMYPLIPFLLVFLLVAVQLLPLALGGELYATVISNGIVIYFWEKAAALAVFIALALWSLRMITASVFALYVVTLPDMTPLSAYRSARKLVYGRRLLIWRKFIFLPVVLLLTAAAVELPLLLYLTPVAPWVFIVLSVAALPVVHGYLYNLYRHML
jgi:hypothetical protein